MPKVDRPTNKQILPSEECLFCAEKHYDTAWRLATERGYSGVNRGATIGELVLAGWHIWRFSEKLAEQIRDIRHAIQNRDEGTVKWEPTLLEITDMCDKEAIRLKGIET